MIQRFTPLDDIANILLVLFVIPGIIGGAITVTLIDKFYYKNQYHANDMIQLIYASIFWASIFWMFIIHMGLRYGLS